MNSLVKTRDNGVFTLSRRRAVRLALAAAVILLSQTVAASEQDFYAPDGSIWMSLEHFTDKADRFPELMNAVQNKLPEEEKRALAAPAPPGQSPAQAAADNAVAPTPLSGEPPARAMNLPVMPGVNKGYGLHVHSTEEEADQGENPEALSVVQPMRPMTPPVMPGLVSQQSGAMPGGEEEDDPQENESAETAEAAAAEAEAAKAAALAQTVRRLSPPVMPGIATAHGVYEAFAEEEDETTDMSEAAAAAAAQEAALAAERAVKAAAMIQAVRQMSLPVLPGVGQSTIADAMMAGEEAGAESLAAQEGQKSLNIRFAGLPGQRMAPPPAKPAAKPGLSAEAKKKPGSKKGPAVAARQTPACEALTAFRQRQLAAIESDRRTLSALQSAIAELGLDQKLDFMTGASQSVAPGQPGNGKNFLAQPEPGLSGGTNPAPNAQEKTKK